MKNALRTIAIAMAACAGSVYATTAEITFFDGTTTITVMDNGPGDSNPAVGIVQTTVTIGVWDVTIANGFTKPFLGDATHPAMDLGFQAHSTAAGSLRITFSDYGFTYSGAATDHLGGTTDNGTVDDFININGNHVIHNGPFVGPTFSGTASGSLTLGSSDVLGLEIDITHTGAGFTSGDKELSTTPDSGSAVALLGIALAGIEILRRKIRAAK